MNLISKDQLLKAFQNRIPPPPEIFELDPDGDILVPHAQLPINSICSVGTPFQASGLVSDPNLKEWVYVDDMHQLQGPFSTIEMDTWYREGHLHLELLVGLNSRERLLSLASFIELSLRLTELSAQNHPN